MNYLFISIYRFFSNKKIALYGLFFLLIFLFAFFAKKLTLETDLSAMMPKEKNQKDVTSVLTHSKSFDKIIVSLSLKDTNEINPDLLTIYADEFANQLKINDKNNLIEKVETKQDESQFLEILEAVQNNLPFLLSEKDYQQIEQKIPADSIQKILETNYRTLGTPGGMALKQLIVKDPLGITYIALKKLNDLKQDENVDLYDGYVVTKDQKQLTFFIHTNFPSSQTDKNGLLEPLLNLTKNELAKQTDFKAIDCTYFGGQLVAAGNAKQMKADTILTLSITIILLLLLFILFFKTALAPLQIMVPVLFGGLFSMAMLYFIKGNVSMMALGASSVILGIAVNYSLHFLSHFKHSGNKEETIAALTKPMTIGSFTTIAAFLCLLFVHSPVLQELGLFTAFSLIGSSICTLVFLPHFIQQKVHQNETSNWLEKISNYNLNKNKWFVVGIIAITIFLSFFMNRVRFNEDMMTMNFMSKELSESQKIINSRNAASLNTLFCVSEGKTLEEALNNNATSIPTLDKLKQENTIKKYSSVGQFILSEKIIAEKINRWNDFWNEQKKNNVLTTVQQKGMALGFNTEAFDGLKNILNKNYAQPDSQYKQVFGKLLKDFVIEEKGNVKIISMIKMSQQNRNLVFDSFSSIPTSYLTDRQLITSQFVKYIRDDFYKILFFSSFIVFFTILISYGRIEIALISFIPMVITWICILGLMGLLGIEFNIINIIISTLIFGLGDDYSIFITDGLIEKYKYGSNKIDSTKTSILLSAITTIIGLGILIFAKHPALRSIAMVSVIGIFSILFVSQTIQPLLFNFFIQNRANKKQHPFSFWDFAKAIFAFTYYVVGCLMVTIIGFILTKCIPFAKEKMKYVYHVVVCKMMWSLLYIMANTTKRIENKDELNFSTPSVLIANHASFLDLLRIISLNPKILLMTNKWVWRSPVFGALVRMADYYPVEEGAEFSIEKLQYWVDKGYSIAVFPEGTRSFTDKIGRFKKGAFYLAEKLNLDIQPVLFHGIGYTMSKGDFLCKNGEVNAVFLPRIKPTDKSWGENYSERTKSISKYFKQEFEKYKAQRETVHYFREQLIKNYIYKGPVLEWYARIKTKLEKNYEPIEKLVPKEGDILDIGCGYGFLDYQLAFTSYKRNITGIDYDDEKIEVANHNFSKTDNINFFACDANQFSFDKKYSCILIMDVLHYLTPDNQISLLQKCNDALSENGILIVRDGIADLKGKHKGTVLTELFSTKIFSFNKTNNDLHFIQQSMLDDFALKNKLKMKSIDNTKFTSNVVTIFNK